MLIDFSKNISNHLKVNFNQSQVSHLIALSNFSDDRAVVGAECIESFATDGIHPFVVNEKLMKEQLFFL